MSQYDWLLGQPETPATTTTPGGGAYDWLNNPSQQQQVPSVSQEPLPFMALGRTPKGEPYYGEGFAGWSRKVAGSLLDPALTGEGLSEDKKATIQSASSDWARRFGETHPWAEPFGEYLQAGAAFYGQHWEQLKQGNVLSPTARIIGRTMSTVIGQGVLPLFSIPEGIVRKVVSAGAGIDEIAGTTSTLPEVSDNPWMEKLQRTGLVAKHFDPVKTTVTLLKYGYGQFGEGDWAAGVSAWIGAQLALGGPIGAALGKGFAGAVENLTNIGANDAAQNRIVQRNLNGSRMVYSAMWNEMTKKEMVRRLEGGENMTFIAESLASPWTELGFSLVLDPLNLVGGIWGKGKYLDDMARAAQKASVIANPELRTAVKLAGEAADDIEAAGHITRAFDLAKDLPTQAMSRIETVIKDYRATALLSTSKVHLYSEIAGGFLQTLVGTFKDNPQDAVEALGQLIKFTSSVDEAERAAALAYMVRSKAGHILLTDGALSSAVIMKRFLGPDKIEDFADVVAAHSGSYEDLAVYLAKRMDSALEETFPSVAKMREAAKAGGEAAEKYAALPARVKALDRLAGEASAVGKVYNRMNRVFSTIYFNTFGFISRNAFTNTFHILADEGPVVAAKALGEAAGNLFSGGRWAGRNREFLDKVYGKGLWEKVIGNATLDKDIDASLKTIMRLNGSVEASMRVTIARNAIERELTRAIKRGVLPDLNSLLQAGFTRDEIGVLHAGMLNSLGDTKKVREIMLAQSTSGWVRTVMKSVPPERLSSFLGSTSLGGDFRALLDAPTVEEFTAQAQKIMKGLEELAGRSAGELSGVSGRDAEVVEGLRDALKTVGGVTQGDLDRVPALYAQAIASHQDAAYEMYKVANAIIGEAYESGNGGAFDVLKQMSELQNKWRSSGSELNTAINTLRSNVVDTVNQIKSGSITPTEGWSRIALVLPNGTRSSLGATPTTVDKGDAIGSIWDFFFTELNKAYDSYDGAQMKEVIGLLHQVAPADFVDMKLTHASKLLDDSREIFDTLTDIRTAKHVTLEDAINAALETAETGMASDLNLRSLGWRRGARALVNAVNEDLGLSKPLDLASLLGQKGVQNPQEVADAWFAEQASKIAFEQARDAVKAAADDTAAKLKLVDAKRAYSQARSAWRKVAKTNGISEGVVDEIARKQIDDISNMQMPYESIEQIPVQEAIDAISKRPSTRSIDQLFRKIFVNGGERQHSIPQAAHENLLGAQRHLKAWTDAIIKNWDTATTASHMNPDKLAALDRVLAIADQRMTEAKNFSLHIGREEANFALHSYTADKTFLDQGLAFMLPYHYWYSRTYMKWMKRMVYSPELVAAYAKYRRTLEQAHAGMPDWWKYNVSSNDLPGVDTDNPLYFNLEATFNPLNGLTGVDFNDPNKRVDWLSRMVDDMGKFGPSVWTPIQWLVAASLNAKGEKDASLRWSGRLIPQTAMLKTLLNHLGVQGPTVGSYGKFNEYDPMVSLYSGGFDPYERRRIGRALAGLAESGQITREQAVDAAFAQDGDIWRMGVNASADERFMGTTASFFLGIGFKNRTQGDLMVDSFYTDFFGLMNSKGLMSSDQFRSQMSELAQKYPFMDTVLISRKGDDERDAAYSYNVLGRVPPGQSDRLYEMVGLTPDLVSRFYEGKGEFVGWTPADISRFMAGITDLGAMLALPDNANRQEYTFARNAYDGMNAYLKATLGEDILDKQDVYYNLPDKSKQAFLDAHPELQQSFDLKDQIIASSPILYNYYGSISRIQRMYQSEMYTYLRAKYGDDITDKWNAYYNQKIEDEANGTKLARVYYKSHPELVQYSEEKAAWIQEINRQLAKFAAYMPVEPTIPLRTDASPQSFTQQQVALAAQPTRQPSWQEWQASLPDSMQRLLLDYFLGSRPLPSAVSSQLNYEARDYGYNSGDEMLTAIGQSIYVAQGTP